MHVTFRVTKRIAAIPDALPGDFLVYHPGKAKRIRLVRELPAYCEAGLMDATLELLNHSVPGVAQDPGVIPFARQVAVPSDLHPRLLARLQEPGAAG